MKKKRTYQETIPRYETIKVYPEYWRIVEWLATPTPLRKPASQRELAKELGIHFTTISRWNAVPEMYGDVRKRIKETMRSELPNVMWALRDGIYRNQSAKEIKLFLQWVDDFVEKQQVEMPQAATPAHVDERIAELKEEFEAKLRASLSQKSEKGEPTEGAPSK